MIYDVINVIPPVVVFPLQTKPVQYKYQMKAEGGKKGKGWKWFVWMEG